VPQFFRITTLPRCIIPHIGGIICLGFLCRNHSTRGARIHNRLYTKTIVQSMAVGGGANGAVEVKTPRLLKEVGGLLLRYGHPGGAEEAGLICIPHLHAIVTRRQAGDAGAEA